MSSGVGFAFFRAAVFSATVGLLSACSDSSTGPASAETPIDVSTARLHQLFDDECIRLRSLDWLQRQAERLRTDCGWLAGNGDEGDCIAKNSGHVDWKIPTRDHSAVLVRVAWDVNATKVPEAKSITECRLSVPAAYGATLKSLASGLTLSGYKLSAPRPGDTSRDEGLVERAVWQTSTPHRYVILDHYMSLPDYAAELHRRTAHSDSWARTTTVQEFLSMYSETAAFPWQIALTDNYEQLTVPELKARIGAKDD